MNKKLHFPVLLLLFLAANFFLARRLLPTAYEIGEDYRISFSSDNPSGSFGGLQGSIHFDPQDLSGSYFDVTVDAKTINTGNGLKNKHAMAQGYFDVDEFPLIAFRSTEIKQLEEGFGLVGLLKIKGNERSIEFPFDFVEEEGRNVFKGSFEIDRTDFDIGPKAASPSHLLEIDLYVPVRLK